MRRFVFAAAAFAALLVGTQSSHAAVVTRDFTLGTIGVAYSYGSFGYTPEDGEYTILTGYNIVSTHVTVDYRPEPGIDRNALVIAMVVPVTGANSEFLQILGTDLVETSPGLFHTEFTSTDYNGTIRDGRYSIETYTMDADGNPTGTPGTLEGTTLSFSVAIPEPSSLALLAPATTLLARRRR